MLAKACPYCLYNLFNDFDLWDNGFCDANAENVFILFLFTSDSITQ